MSIFSWLFPASPPPKALAESSGLSRMEPTRPVHRRGAKEAPSNNAQAANRKSERLARRELLYTVVREAMVRAGVLSSSYKFKVLSLDGRGRQFLVMVDLAQGSEVEAVRMAEIEALIAQAAKARHDIVVTSVYWRMNEHVAVGDPTRRRAGAAAPAGPSPAGARLPTPVSAKVAAAPAIAAREPAPRSPYEPIDADEVEAFRKALAAGAREPAAATASELGQGASAKAFDGTGRHGPQSYTLLTGFEDTELPDAELRGPALSGTQYGELK